MKSNQILPPIGQVTDNKNGAVKKSVKTEKIKVFVHCGPIAVIKPNVIINNTDFHIYNILIHVVSILSVSLISLTIQCHIKQLCFSSL